MKFDDLPPILAISGEADLDDVDDLDEAAAYGAIPFL
jgi:hypothetical protein